MMKVLVIRYSSLGDVILTTPIIRALVQQQGITVHFVTKRASASLLEDNPYISKLWVHESTSLRDLKEENYDHVIDLQGSWRSVRLKTSLGHFRKSYKKERWRTRRFLRSKNSDLAPSHVLLRYFDNVKSLQIVYDGLGLDVYHGESVVIEPSKKPHCAVVLGGTHITKRLPPALVKGFIQREDLTFSLLGGADVDPGAYDQDSHIQNFIGKTSLKESIFILNQADMVITGDTGLMHIAAALSKPMVVVWGSTSPDMGFKPIYSEDSQVINRDVMLNLDCQPCSKYGKDKCPLTHMNCLNNIPVNRVNVSIDEIVALFAQNDGQKRLFHR